MSVIHQASYSALYTFFVRQLEHDSGKSRNYCIYIYMHIYSPFPFHPGPSAGGPRPHGRGGGGGPFDWFDRLNGFKSFPQTSPSLCWWTALRHAVFCWWQFELEHIWSYAETPMRPAVGSSSLELVSKRLNVDKYIYICIYTYINIYIYI